MRLPMSDDAVGRRDLLCKRADPKLTQTERHPSISATAAGDLA